MTACHLSSVDYFKNKNAERPELRQFKPLYSIISRRHNLSIFSRVMRDLWQPAPSDALQRSVCLEEKFSQFISSAVFISLFNFFDYTTIFGIKKTYLLTEGMSFWCAPRGSIPHVLRHKNPRGLSPARSAFSNSFAASVL